MVRGVSLSESEVEIGGWRADQGEPPLSMSYPRMLGAGISERTSAQSSTSEREVGDGGWREGGNSELIVGDFWALGLRLSYTRKLWFSRFPQTNSFLSLVTAKQSISLEWVFLLRSL